MNSAFRRADAHAFSQAVKLAFQLTSRALVLRDVFEDDWK